MALSVSPFVTTLMAGRLVNSSGAMDTDVSEEKGQSLNLSRLYALKGPSRPSTSDGSSRFKGGFSPPKEVKETEVQRGKDPALLRKRTTSTPSTNEPNGVSMGPFKAGQSILDQIGEPDYKGWMRKKGDRYNTWKLRYFVLKGPHLYYLRSNSTMVSLFTVFFFRWKASTFELQETKIKGYVNIAGYKVVADENANPGRYGFKIVHDHDKPHIFSSEEKAVVREWMKAIMKATIGRDYTSEFSSCLTIAQTI
jgi:hypothetical protein